MKVLLVRVGIDNSAGYWNAPIDTDTNEFIYIPIPENGSQKYNLKIKIRYDRFISDVKGFCKQYNVDYITDLGFPAMLNDEFVHLDPDFEHLTYGDNGKARGKCLKELQENDLVVFYASMKSINRNLRYLIYAIIGFYTVEKIIRALDLPEKDRYKNAHSRKTEISENDLIVLGKKGKSGRLVKCIPIGEYYNKAYRVRKDILDEWGGLSVNEGYIQRSINPPFINNPDNFLKWIKKFELNLVERNN